MKITLRRLLFAAQWSWLTFVLYVLVGTTLTALLRGMVFVVLATLSSLYLKRWWGITEWIGVPVVFLVLCLLVWAVLMGRILLFFPFPLCKKGKCDGIDDYSWPLGTFFGKCWWGVYWYSCRCGDKYLRRGKRFMEFIPKATVPPSPWVNVKEGATRPYKKLVGFRQWADDLE